MLITIVIRATSGEDIEESALIWERVLRNTRVIAPDDDVVSVVVTQE